MSRHESHTPAPSRCLDVQAPDEVQRAEPLEPALMQRIFIDGPQQRYRLNVDAPTSARRPPT